MRKWARHPGCSCSKCPCAPQFSSWESSWRFNQFGDHHFSHPNAPPNAPYMAVPAWFLSKSGFCDGECLGPTPRQWSAGGLKSRLVLTWTNGVLATCYFVILDRPSCTFSLSSLFCKSWMTSNHPAFKWSSCCWSLKEKIAGNPSVIFLRIWLLQSDAPTRCNRDCLAKAHLLNFCKSSDDHLVIFCKKRSDDFLQKPIWWFFCKSTSGDFFAKVHLVIFCKSPSGKFLQKQIW